MPYSRKSDLPEGVREALPSEAQSIYMAAFNSFAESNPDADEEQFHKVAWSAVKRKYRKDGDKWVRKTEDSGIELNDTVMLDGVRRTPDGYLAAYANVARTGIQLYRGYEVGRPDMDVVRVYRPPEEVFAPDSLRSLAHRPVTLDHPPGEVNAENWRDYAVGQTGDEVDGRDGRYVRVPLVLMDASAIKSVESGNRELSVGYRTNLRFEDGVTPEGEAYDAVQSAIRANHLAVVRRARGGPGLRIGDEDQNERKDKMTTRNITIDGVAVEVSDTAAQIIQRAADQAAQSIAAKDAEIASLTTRAQDAEAKLEAEKAQITTEHKTAVDAKDAEIATLKQQLADAEMTPEKLDTMVKDREAVIDRAKKLHPAVVIDGRGDADIRRQVVDAKLGDAAKGWSDEQIAVSFQTLTVSAHDHRPIGQALSQPGPRPTTDADAAYEEMVKRQTGAWKRGQQAAH